MGKFLGFLIAIAIVVWIAVHLFTGPYLNEEKALVVVDEDRVCTENSECILVTENYRGCEARYAINQAGGWHYEIAKSYRSLVDTVMRRESLPLEECPPVTQGIPVCGVDSMCVIDPDAPTNTYF